MKLVNLHTHSQWSDGRLPARTVMNQAAHQTDLRAVALTDHDTLAGIEPFFDQAAQLARQGLNPPQPVAGIELSLYEPSLAASVHMVGLFPLPEPALLTRVLDKAWSVLGDHCAKMNQNRGKNDLEKRLVKAFELNLDHLAEYRGTLEEAKAMVLAGLDQRRQDLFEADKKQNDLIKLPSPATYQDLIENWPQLTAPSYEERIGLYVLRKSSQRAERLGRILIMEDGLTETDARQKAAELQGCLAMVALDPKLLPDPLTGMSMLNEAGAVTILAHPAIDNHRISLAEYDQAVTLPLIKAGLNGIETAYPYDPIYRQAAMNHYQRLARENGLLTSCGTDYHGDGRSGLTDPMLTIDTAERLLAELEVELPQEAP